MYIRAGSGGSSTSTGGSVRLRSGEAGLGNSGYGVLNVYDSVASGSSLLSANRNIAKYAITFGRSALINGGLILTMQVPASRSGGGSQIDLTLGCFVYFNSNAAQYDSMYIKAYGASQYAGGIANIPIGHTLIIRNDRTGGGPTDSSLTFLTPVSALPKQTTWIVMYVESGKWVRVS